MQSTLGNQPMRRWGITAWRGNLSVGASWCLRRARRHNRRITDDFCASEKRICRAFSNVHACALMEVDGMLQRRAKIFSADVALDVPDEEENTARRGGPFWRNLIVACIIIISCLSGVLFTILAHRRVAGVRAHQILSQQLESESSHKHDGILEIQPIVHTERPPTIPSQYMQKPSQSSSPPAHPLAPSLTVFFQNGKKKSGGGAATKMEQVDDPTPWTKDSFLVIAFPLELIKALAAASTQKAIALPFPINANATAAHPWTTIFHRTTKDSFLVVAYPLELIKALAAASTQKAIALPFPINANATAAEAVAMIQKLKLLHLVKLDLTNFFPLVSDFMRSFGVLLREWLRQGGVRAPQLFVELKGNAMSDNSLAFLSRKCGSALTRIKMLKANRTAFDADLDCDMSAQIRSYEDQDAQGQVNTLDFDADMDSGLFDAFGPSIKHRTEFYKAIKSKNKSKDLVLWTLDTNESWSKAMDVGVDIMITNYPEKTRDWLEDQAQKCAKKWHLSGLKWH
eukprot:gene15949-22081_t